MSYIGGLLRFIMNMYMYMHVFTYNHAFIIIFSVFSHLSCAEFLGSLPFAETSGNIHAILTEVKYIFRNYL